MSTDSVEEVEREYCLWLYFNCEEFVKTQKKANIFLNLCLNSECSVILFNFAFHFEFCSFLKFVFFEF